MISFTERLKQVAMLHSSLANMPRCKWVAAILLSISVLYAPTNRAQEVSNEFAPSTARQWIDSLLFAIRIDLARPTVHARNLYHLSAGMFDAWAIYEPDVLPSFTTAESTLPDCSAIHSYRTNSATTLTTAEKDLAQNQAVGMAAWTILNHRFIGNRRSAQMLERFRQTALSQGLQSAEITDANEFSAQNLGIRVGRCIIANGLADNSNELQDYRNINYTPANTPLNPSTPGNPGQIDPNRWQPLQLDIFIDQSGIMTDTPEFLGADWGQLDPFAMQPSDRTELTIDGETVPVWLDPGAPPTLGDDAQANRIYQLNHLTTALWSGHLDPADNQTIDISPSALGNLPHLDTLPNDQASILDLYDQLEGGFIGSDGHALNPNTSQPYASNVVPRGDYTRVLAEFWADGPDSETPPGHWFDIYNEAVVSHSDHERKFAGLGEEVDALSYDVVAYLALGGALHDSAIAAWSVKRAYDYARPITAIRYMAALGQSTDPELDSYHIHGIPLIPNRIEVIDAGDPLAGRENQNVGKIKGYVWIGPDFIGNPSTDTAGVGWQLLENWWPYQRPTFVTPPFAGYVSGHSTFSRAAAEVLTALTGDDFFPGGMAEFLAPANDFLVFEQGPSVDVRLQWATYRDAADQTSLSRIWGGIHPPADDLVGRKMGEIIGKKSWNKVSAMLDGTLPDTNVMTSPVRVGCAIDRQGNHLLMLFLLVIACARLAHKALLTCRNPRANA